VYRPDTTAITRHTRWFAGGTVITDCGPSDPDLDRDGTCDAKDTDDDGDGTDDSFDCRPLDPAIHPGAIDVPDDGIDQDCSGSDTVTCFVDADGDGHGSTATVLRSGNCSGGNASTSSDDCDDSRLDVFPSAPEQPDDGIDQDCDGTDSEVCYVDADRDRFGSTSAIVPNGTCATGGWSSASGDCNDADAAVFPGAVETADDGIDQDCSGTDSVVCFVDTDGDGFGSSTTLVEAGGTCAAAGASNASGDCDDGDSAVHPGAVDVVGDGIDQDCSGSDAPDVDATADDGSAGGAPGSDAHATHGGASGASGSAGSDATQEPPHGGGDSSGCTCRLSMPFGEGMPRTSAPLAWLVVALARRLRARSSLRRS
jgi:hypothetical protein